MGIAAAAASVADFLGIAGTAAAGTAAAGGAAAAATAGTASIAGIAAATEVALPSLAFGTAEAASSAVPAWISMASTAVSGVTGAIGAIEQGQAQAASARYNAAIASRNAAVARENATIAGQSGEVQAYNVGAKGRAMVGAELANEAASGVDVMSGSPVLTRTSTAELAELDATTARANATREAYGYSQQAATFTAESQLDTFEAKNAQMAGLVSGTTTFLGAAGDAASNYYKYQLQGGFTG